MALEVLRSVNCSYDRSAELAAVMGCVGIVRKKKRK